MQSIAEVAKDLRKFKKATKANLEELEDKFRKLKQVDWGGACFLIWHRPSPRTRPGNGSDDTWLESFPSNTDTHSVVPQGRSEGAREVCLRQAADNNHTPHVHKPNRHCNNARGFVYTLNNGTDY